MTSVIDKEINTEKDIIEELHEGRARLLAKFNGDLRALFEDARQRDEVSKSKVVNCESSRISGSGDRSRSN